MKVMFKTKVMPCFHRVPW